ncbi:MAG: energy-coupling factor transporter ATPase [Clostridia bacterium]|nr:energy-coupling factor transporter ATPase [Clostridia bacterium]MBQ7289056.1 energy-coupling factor transporter ATPase [Clostridia bacterium]
MSDIIQLKNVSYSYDMENQKDSVLKNLTLSFQKGSFTAILGHNGSGKSTLAKLLNTLLKPTSGNILVDGLSAQDEKNALAIRKKVGLVFQNPDNQLVATAVEDDVAFGLENIGVPQPEMVQRVEEALRAVDMLEHRKTSPYNLSGGQKQRVAIAGILAMEPECIVFDEPTAMLDPKGRKEVMDTILSLSASKNITVILITHFMEEAAMADRVVVMDNGTVLMDGSPETVFTRVEELQAVGLDVPVAAQLIHELNLSGKDLDQSAISVDACVQALSDALVTPGRK